jgi:mRNA-degrading endonuclease RelE of RelBE toxin-antitoxin system
MFTLIYRPAFYRDLEKIVKDRDLRGDIISKTSQLKFRAPIGKRLRGYPYWSIRIGGFRIIYQLQGQNVDFLRIIPRDRDYRELRDMP